MSDEEAAVIGAQQLWLRPIQNNWTCETQTQTLGIRRCAFDQSATISLSQECLICFVCFCLSLQIKRKTILVFRRLSLFSALDQLASVTESTTPTLTSSPGQNRPSSTPSLSYQLQFHTKTHHFFVQSMRKEVAADVGWVMRFPQVNAWSKACMLRMNACVETLVKF